MAHFQLENITGTKYFQSANAKGDLVSRLFHGNRFLMIFLAQCALLYLWVALKESERIFDFDKI